jgi:hypothetical protein
LIPASPIAFAKRESRSDGSRQGLWVAHAAGSDG